MGELSFLVGNLRGRDDACDRERPCNKSDMIHSGPTLRPRSRPGGNTPPETTRPTRPSIVGTADFMVADLGAPPCGASTPLKTRRASPPDPAIRRPSDAPREGWPHSGRAATAADGRAAAGRRCERPSFVQYGRAATRRRGRHHSRSVHAAASTECGERRLEAALKCG